MTAIAHGTRTAYLVHKCKCLDCMAYQRAIGSRARQRLRDARQCLDCSQPLVTDDISRCAACLAHRRTYNRERYVTKPKTAGPNKGWNRLAIAPKVKARDTAARGDSWWVTAPRDTFTAEAERRFARVTSSTVHVLRPRA